MLATLVDQPFHRPGWVYEEKYDGIRVLAGKDGRRVTLLSRNLKDRTADFPAIAHAIAALPASTLVLDGEVVIFEASRVSHFQLLQRREAAGPSRSTRSSTASSAARTFSVARRAERRRRSGRGA
jgi:ATP-dependent DNA ligase